MPIGMFSKSGGAMAPVAPTPTRTLVCCFASTPSLCRKEQARKNDDLGGDWPFLFRFSIYRLHYDLEAKKVREQYNLN